MTRQEADTLLQKVYGTLVKLKHSPSLPLRFHSATLLVCEAQLTSFRKTDAHALATMRNKVAFAGEILFGILPEVTDPEIARQIDAVSAELIDLAHAIDVQEAVGPPTAGPERRNDPPSLE